MRVGPPKGTSNLWFNVTHDFRHFVSKTRQSYRVISYFVKHGNKLQNSHLAGPYHLDLLDELQAFIVINPKRAFLFLHFVLACTSCLPPLFER
jgi:hypothetical protein